MIIDDTQFEENSLPYYVAKGDREGLNTWIKEHPSELEALTKQYYIKERELYDTATPLSIAAYNGHLTIVNRLLTFEAVQNNMTAMDNEALQCAAENGHLAVVNKLLKFKAVRDDIAACNNEALRCAAADNMPTLIAPVEANLPLQETNKHVTPSTAILLSQKSIFNTPIAHNSNNNDIDTFPTSGLK